MGIFGDLDMSSVVPNVGGGGGGLDIAKAGLIIGIVFIFVVIAVISFFIFYKKFEAKKYKNKITFVQTFKGRTQIIGEDIAQEMTIPKTNIKVFHLKKLNTYTPKLTRLFGKNHYILWVSNGGEWVNTHISAFDGEKLGIDNESRPSMVYASENLKEIIQRNYKDKAIKWWKEYSHIIGFIIITVVLVIGVVVMFGRFGKVMGILSGASQNFKEGALASQEAIRLMTEFMKEQCATSGVISTT